jgi:hypothetical protein
MPKGKEQVGAGLKIERGMLLLCPAEDVKGPQVFAAVSPEVLVASYSDFSCRLELRRPVLPKGWILLDGPSQTAVANV